MRAITAQVVDQNMAQWGWSLLDMGSFGFASVTFHTLLPVLFKQSFESSGSQSHDTIAAWGYAMSVANMIGFIFSPFVGSYVDATSRRKLFMVLFAGLAILDVLIAVAESQSHYAMIAFTVIATVGYNMSCFIYNSLLIFNFRHEAIYTASCVSTALSNLGATFMLFALLCVLLYNDANTKSNIPKHAAAVIVLVAAVWYATFVTFFLCTVAEPNTSRTIMRQGNTGSDDSGAQGCDCGDGGEQKDPEVGFVSNMYASMVETFTGDEMWAVRRYLLANLLISEASGTVFHMSTVYAVSECGFHHMIIFVATLMNRFLGFFFPFGWAVVIECYDARNSYLVVCFLMTVAISLCGSMVEAWQYWVLSALLSCIGTGGFSISRSMIAMLSPPGKVTQIYGFSSFVGQIAGLMGPLMFATVASVTQLPRIGFCVCFLFMVTGVYIFTTIPPKEFERMSNPVVADEESTISNTISKASSPRESSYGTYGRNEVRYDPVPSSSQMNPTDAAESAPVPYR